MKKILLVVLILMLALLVACSLAERPPETTAEEDVMPASDNTVRITAAGFEPKTLNVKAGETVTFVNENTGQHWPASTIHPTHTVYPGSDIKKCRSGEEIFDACRSLAQGESFTFTFNEKGSWNYHDHLRPGNRGTIIVE